ncbi:magnesium transporter MgtE [Desulfosarcina ovata subsp. sediminis]|uniref:Magnesium transporter MgtE n=1 Tax=Desulfosarcina ovata subsp. sediminis TaxID=885957 RepID=A0A5K7ZV26_9BACT|nr:magnesium transporter [Desulfosarcina ovata]BBO84093.1 magnesium transporter MgtE [Desulfosarcina ovata subsp. sediminis]
MILALEIERLADCSGTQLPRTTIDALKNLHPSDIAEALETSGCSPSQLVEILFQIGNHKSCDAFAQLDIETQQACLEATHAQTMLRFVENMEPDDRVDLLKAVDEDVREAIMPLIAQAERNDIRRLWNYAEGTAGAAMTTEYAVLPQHVTVAEALEQMRLQAPNKETIYTIHITDSQRRLLGILSLRDLIMSKPRITLDAIMQTRVISVPHDMAEEDVAAVIAKYDLLAVPVVDGDNRLLGIITVDDVIDIMEAENTEDFQRISAVVPFDEGYFKRPLPQLFWSRFLWLAVLLFTSLLSTTIMEMNSAVIHQMVALAFFIPMVTGTCGNAGTQSATMVVRALALGEVGPGDFLRVFRRELFMGLALGMTLGLMAYFRVYLQDQNMLLGWTVGVALLATLLTANLTGALMPLVLKKLRLDPALTAGPFIATVIDAVGISLYFQIAMLLMNVMK